MRITRDSLLKVAKSTVFNRTYKNRSVLCVYLAGSLLGGEALLGGTADIDLIFVHDGEPPTPREILRVNDDVHLDIAHYPRTAYQNTRLLREDPWLGCSLCENPFSLHDTQHWYEFTQSSVCAQFNRPETILQRARPLAESARTDWMELSAGGRFTPKRLAAYLKAVEKTANAIACLNGPPLTERRFLLNFPTRAQALGKPDLAAALIGLIMGTEPPQNRDWELWQSNWSAALAAAAAGANPPPRLQSPRLRYYTSAASVLWDDQPAAALWILLRTWTAALISLPQGTLDLAAWQAACTGVGLGKDGFPARLQGLDAFLDTVEETLEDWARQNGLQ